MINFEKMNNQEFEKYIDFMKMEYAQDISANFSLPMDKALEESEMMVKETFSDGLLTEGQYIFNISDSNSTMNVGIIWFNVNTEINRAYLYHIYIHELHRNKGYGTKSLKALEAKVKELGMDSLALSVFGKNEGAYYLYKKLGYTTSSISMHKVI
ncbi:MAG: GNAT family N-acetyltransferase [Firmicutes bacterium]|nr:GNAT family N-acetyltransferase [Bacillota bacterium]